METTADAIVTSAVGGSFCDDGEKAEVVVDKVDDLVVAKRSRRDLTKSQTKQNMQLAHPQRILSSKVKEVPIRLEN